MTSKDAEPDRVIARAALERVLARATELQADTADAPEAISEARLLDIGREVGIPAEHLQLALAEERARSPFASAESGVLFEGMGVVQVSAQRAVAGTPAELLADIDAWMKREEGLDTNRRSTNRLSWSPLNGPLSAIYNALGRRGRRLDLVRADEVSATVTPVDATRAVVRLDANLAQLRRTQRNLMLGLGIGLNLGAFVVLAAPIVLLLSGGAIPVVGVLAVLQAAAGYGIWRLLRNSYRRTLQRVHEKLEQLLDNLEHGAMVARPTLIGQLRDAMLEATTPLRGLRPPREL